MSKKTHIILPLIICILISGCAKTPEEPASVRLGALSREETTVEPEVIIPWFDNAKAKGTVQIEGGTLPGASPGTWYTITIEDVEYYYGIMEGSEDVYTYGVGYAIVGNQHKLKCGLEVGMSEEDVLEQYPNAAVINFDNTYIGAERTNNAGWNGVAFPDNWTEQFDYVIILEETSGEPEALPLYLALLVKDKVVTAITFYNPTAG